MDDLTGGLALLFTDIEGSTDLVRELKGNYGLALRVHRRMLERCFDECRGMPIGSEGDSLYYVFPSVALAVDAAVSAQQKVDHHAWPEGQRLRVRMGLHTGPLTVSGGEYVGLTVHEVARICAAAHGGQILCSTAVARVLADTRSPWVVRDLGIYRLRGFPEGHHLFQVCAEGLEDVFPVPRDSVRYGGARVSMWFRDEGRRRPQGPGRRTTEPARRHPATLTFRSRDGGPLAAGIDVEIGPAEPPAGGAFRLVVREGDSVVEEYDGLTQGGPCDAATIVNAHSTRIRIAGPP